MHTVSVANNIEKINVALAACWIASYFYIRPLQTMNADVFFHVVAMCDRETREALGFNVERCIQLHLPPTRLKMESPAWNKLKCTIEHKYCFRSSRREYESTFFDEANKIVVTVQPVWYCFKSRRRITMIEFSMKVVAYVEKEELVHKRKRRCNGCTKGTRLWFDLTGKTVRGVNYCYKTGETVYEDVMPERNKIDFCVGE